MNLSALLKRLTYTEIYREDDLPEDITDVVFDSRKITDGSLFIAISGFKADGHRFLDQAAERGAVAAVVERIDPAVPLPQIRVENSRRALAETACLMSGDPSRELTMIGVTGSNGKTTTSMMLVNILRAAAKKVGVMGTVMYSSGKTVEASEFTTPDPITLQHFLREMVEEKNTHCVMEVSSMGLEQYRVYGIDYDVVGFINISHEHIDHHGSFENYLNEKKKLVTGASPETRVVLNADDPIVSDLKDETEGVVLMYGHREKADIKAVDVDQKDGFYSFRLVTAEEIQAGNITIPQTDIAVRLRVSGYHMMLDALAAASLALAAGIAPEYIVEGLEGYQGVERRFECLMQEPVLVFDDHFANYGNIRQSLSTLEPFQKRGVHLVYALRGSRGVDTMIDTARAMNDFMRDMDLKSVILSRSSETVKEKDIVLPEEEKAFLDTLEIPYDILVDRLDEAVDALLDRVEENDVILLAGCQGMDAGGRLFLNKWLERHPDANADAVLAPLKDRQCGWE